MTLDAAPLVEWDRSLTRNSGNFDDPGITDHALRAGCVEVVQEREILTIDKLVEPHFNGVTAARQFDNLRERRRSLAGRGNIEDLLVIDHLDRRRPGRHASDSGAGRQHPDVKHPLRGGQ